MVCSLLMARSMSFIRRVESMSGRSCRSSSPLRPVMHALGGLVKPVHHPRSYFTHHFTASESPSPHQIISLSQIVTDVERVPDRAAYATLWRQHSWGSCTIEKKSFAHYHSNQILDAKDVVSGSQNDCKGGDIRMVVSWSKCIVTEEQIWIFILDMMRE